MWSTELSLCRPQGALGAAACEQDLSPWRKAELHGLISHLRQMRPHRDSKGIYLKSERMCMEVGKAGKVSEVIGHERFYPKKSIPPQD